MNVEVDDQDMGETVLTLGVPRADGDVVEETETHRAPGERVVSGRTDSAEGALHSPLHNGIDGREDRAHSQPRGVERFRRDDRVRVEVGDPLRRAGARTEPT